MAVKKLSRSEEVTLKISRLAQGFCPKDGGEHYFGSPLGRCRKCEDSRASLLCQMFPGYALSEVIRNERSI